MTHLCDVLHRAGWLNKKGYNFSEFNNLFKTLLFHYFLYTKLIGKLSDSCFPAQTRT